MEFISELTEAEPAVTKPSFWKIDFNFWKSSILACGRGCSSTSTVTSPFLVFTVVGAISALKRPASFAAILI